MHASGWKNQNASKKRHTKLWFFKKEKKAPGFFKPILEGGREGRGTMQLMISEQLELAMVLIK